MTITAEWAMVILVCVGTIGTVMGYMIRQNSRIATCETEIKQLTRIVEKNVETVNNLAINMSSINSKLSLLLDLKKG